MTRQKLDTLHEYVVFFLDGAHYGKIFTEMRFLIIEYINLRTKLSGDDFDKNNFFLDKFQGFSFFHNIPRGEIRRMKLD